MPKKHDTETKTFAAWFGDYIRERAKFRGALTVLVPTPLNSSEVICIRYAPNDEARDLDMIFEDSLFQNYFECPMTLFNEIPSKTVLAELNTALSLINKLQGLNAAESLAFMTQLFIFAVDWQRAKKGVPSMLLGLPRSKMINAKYAQLSFHEVDELASPDVWDKNKISRFCNVVFFKLENLLDFWHAVGMRCATGMFDNETTSGMPSYYSVPPIWITYDSMRKHGVEVSPPPKTLELIDRNVANLIAQNPALLHILNGYIYPPTLTSSKRNRGRPKKHTDQEIKPLVMQIEQLKSEGKKWSDIQKITGFATPAAASQFYHRHRTKLTKRNRSSEFKKN